MSGDTLTAAVAPSEEAQRFARGTRDSSRIAFNVVTNWIAQIATIISGFILPRFIDERLGAEVLGIWDFGWSMYAYVQLAEVGFGSSVSQYVAQHRALGDWASLNRILSSCLSLFCLNAIAGLIVSGGLVFFAPMLVGADKTHLVQLAQFTVIVLGLAAVVQMPVRVYNGVITGSMRFDLLNLVEAGSDILVVFLLVGALIAGMGLRTMAVIALAREIAAAIAKFYIARSLCPQLCVRLRWGSRAEILDIMKFGGKTTIMEISRVLVYQTNSMIVMYFLGPAALALYSRPRALVMYLARFVSSYAKVFVPAASSMKATGTREEMIQLLARSTNYCLYIVLPGTAALTVLGGPLLQAWMGSSYRESGVQTLTILAIGHLAFYAMTPAYQILMGLSCHGAASVAYLIVGVVSALMGWVFMSVFSWGLFGAALSLALPLTVLGLVIMPVLSARAVGTTWVDFYRRLSPGPFLALIPFLAIMLVSSALLHERLYWNLIVSLCASSGVLVVLYWFFVLPRHMRTTLIKVASPATLLRKWART